MNQVRQTEQQAPRYTGVVCRRCIQPIATVEEREGTAAVVCPACGHTRTVGPALKI
jgi:DNA-directed RNA polymerase subunit RPC12/RpoP